MNEMKDDKSSRRLWRRPHREKVQDSLPTSWCERLRKCVGNHNIGICLLDRNLKLCQDVVQPSKRNAMSAIDVSQGSGDADLQNASTSRIVLMEDDW